MLLVVHNFSPSCRGEFSLFLCRLKWLASISEVLELWVSAALSSPDNTPIIGSNDIGYSRSASNEVSLF